MALRVAFEVALSLWAPGAGQGGWYDGGAGNSCDEGCAAVGLECTEEGLLAHNRDVDSGDELYVLATSLGMVVGEDNCSGAFWDSASTPFWNPPHNCMYSNPDRALGTIDCSAPPHQAHRHRVCYCHPPFVVPQLEWAISAGGPGFDTATKIVMDKLNNVVVTGRFGLWSREGGPAFFGHTRLDSAGDYHHFEASFDRFGSVQWSAKAHRQESRAFNDRATDAAGNLYETGRFSGTRAWGNFSRTSTGSGDVFVTKRDGAGDLQWVVQFGGARDDSGNALVVDAAGKVCVAGRFSGDADFGDFELTSRGGADVFIAGLAANGEVEWAVGVGGAGRDVAYGLALDVFGDIYATGAFVDSLFLGSQVLTSGGGADVFVAKLSRGDRSVQWALSAGSSGDDAGLGIVLDEDGSAYATGEFRGNASFGEATLISRGFADVFLMKLNGSFS